MDALDRQVVAAMREAADRAVLRHYRALADDDMREKTPGDMVTIADHESEAILAERLAAIEPDASLVGEEAAAADTAVLDRLSHDLCWIVDPLDGTNNYAHGRPPFGIIVALAEGGNTVRGWLYDPLAERICTARRGGGAFIDDQRVQARPTGEQQPVAAISLVFLDPTEREAIRTHIAPHYRLVDIPLCAAEQYPRIVLGENDVSLFERTLPWDHAAGVLFLNEAGGRAARPDGRPYRPDSRESGLIGAASPALYEKLAEKMADMPSPPAGRVKPD